MNPQPSQPEVQVAVDLAKQQRQLNAVQAKAKTEDRKAKRKEAMQKFSLRIKNGIEKVTTWYEENWLELCYDGIIAGAAVMLFAQVLALSIGEAGFLLPLTIIGGWVAVAPFLLALAFWAIKVTIDVVKATVKGIRHAAQHIPEVKLATEAKLKDLTKNLPPVSAEQTA